MEPQTSEGREGEVIPYTHKTRKGGSGTFVEARYGWPPGDYGVNEATSDGHHSPSAEYKMPELAADRLASRASSVITGGTKQPLFIRSGEPGNVASPSAINIDAWLPPYGTPDIIGNGRHCADVSASTSSFPAVETPPLLELLHSGRRTTAPTAATGRPDPAARPAEMQQQLFQFKNSF